MFFVFTLGLSTGLIVAWNMWDQPKAIKALYDKTLGQLTNRNKKP